MLGEERAEAARAAQKAVADFADRGGGQGGQGVEAEGDVYTARFVVLLPTIHEEKWGWFLFFHSCFVNFIFVRFFPRSSCASYSSVVVLADRGGGQGGEAVREANMVRSVALLPFIKGKVGVAEPVKPAIRRQWE